MAKLLFFCVFGLGFSFTSKLYGDDNLLLVQEGCGHLDMTEIQRLTELELSQSNETRPYKMTLVCREDILRIVVYYEHDKPPLERSIKLSESKLKERIVSLTATQLVSTNLRSEAVKRQVERTTNTEEIETVYYPPVAPVGHLDDEGVDHVVVSAGGGVKPHGKFSLPLGYGLIRSDFWFSDRWGMMSFISFEGGLAKRDLGAVRAMSGLVGLGVIWRLVGTKHIHLDALVGASVGYTYLKGAPRQDAKGDYLSGIAGEYVLGFSVVVEAKNIVLALDFLGGYTMENPIGIVDSDESVTLGGFWLGGGLRIGAKKS